MQPTRHLALAALLVAVPCAAGAEEPAPPDDRFDFEVGWDRGITYRYEQRLADVDPTGVVGDTVLRGRIGASLYLDGGWTAGDLLSDQGWGGKVRRARIYTAGRLERWLETAYKFEFAVESSDVYLNDFYLRWEPDRFVDTLRVGYFDAPLAFQNLVASSSRVLTEVAAPVAAFVPGFRLGVEVGRAHADPSLTWFLNLSSVGQDPEVGDASDQPLRLGGRLVWRPWGPAEDDAPLLHLGASLGYAVSAGSQIRHRARPETFLVDDVVDTGDVDGGETTLGLEAVWRRGPTIVQGELFVAQLHATDVGDPTFWGFYVQANRALTGEVRPYDARSAVFRRLEPAQPFHWNGAGSGGLELAARLSWLDLSEEGVSGGRLLTLSLGPCWTWNANVRVLAGWVVGHVSSRPDDGWLGLFQTRLELAF